VPDPTPLTDAEVEEMERLCGEATRGEYLTEGALVYVLEIVPNFRGRPEPRNRIWAQVSRGPETPAAEAQAVAAMWATARTFIPRAIARIREQDERIAAEYANGHTAGDRDRFARCKEDIARALGVVTDTEWAVLVAKVSTLESRLRRYEPRVGDRVTGENVPHLPGGTVVGWRYNDTDWTATRTGRDEWRVSNGDYHDDETIADPGSDPTFILSLPPEASDG
jgi:hypothetical protein